MGAAIGGLGLQGAVDHLDHLVVLIGEGASRTQLVMQAFQAKLPVALAPFANGHPGHPHPLGDGGVGLARPQANTI
jgi:hypothetical protein